MGITFLASLDLRIIHPHIASVHLAHYAAILLIHQHNMPMSAPTTGAILISLTGLIVLRIICPIPALFTRTTLLLHSIWWLCSLQERSALRQDGLECINIFLTATIRSLAQRWELNPCESTTLRS